MTEILTGVALLVAAVIGAVELVKAFFETDANTGAWKPNWRTFAIIIIAGLVGSLAAVLPEINITALQGAVVGFAASGVITTANTIKGK